MSAADAQQPLTIGRLERVPLEELWRHEERSFTPWLEDNPDVLSDTIGIQLSAVQRESPVGAYTGNIRPLIPETCGHQLR